jgi:hypothetical protein
MEKERFSKRSECIRSGQISNVFVVVSKPGKILFDQSKEDQMLTGTDQNKNHQNRMQEVRYPGTGMYTEMIQLRIFLLVQLRILPMNFR